jgi:hypothetical protein
LAQRSHDSSRFAPARKTPPCYITARPDDPKYISFAHAQRMNDHYGRQSARNLAEITRKHFSRLFNQIFFSDNIIRWN